MTKTLFTQGLSFAHPNEFPVVHIPTLLIYGNFDAQLRMGMVEREKQLMPDATVSIYPDAGHSPFMEAPNKFNKELDAFISDSLPNIKNPH